MTTFAYPKMYLERAADNLGTMFDCAVNHFHYDANQFMEMFLESGIGNMYALGYPNIILGKTGKELCNEVYYKVTGKELEGYMYEEEFLNKSREYWAGWILAKYQWYSCQSFETIIRCVKMSDLVKMYHPLHEAIEDKTFEILDKQLLKNGIELYNSFNESYEIVSLKTYKNPLNTDISQIREHKKDMKKMER